jgi:very-short-patch-repair endonuclease
VHVDLRIAQLAARQHGLVTLGQLRHLGLGRGALRHRRATGRLHRVYVGVYAVGHRTLTTEARLLAAVMSCGNDAALSHEHAAYLWGLIAPWDEIDLHLVHVTTGPSSRRGRRPGIVVHRSSLHGDERMRRHEIPVTSPARTLIDLAAQSELRPLERVTDRALTEGLTTVTDLRRAATERGARPGAAAIRDLLDGAERYDSITNSQLEEAFLALVRDAGLPEPALNARVEGFLVDAAWHRERVVVELDGYRWHRSRMRQESDRNREVKLRSAGWLPLRYSSLQVFDARLAVVADLAGVLVERRLSA